MDSASEGSRGEALGGGGGRGRGGVTPDARARLDTTPHPLQCIAIPNTTAVSADGRGPVFTRNCAPPSGGRGAGPRSYVGIGYACAAGVRLLVGTLVAGCGLRVCLYKPSATSSRWGDHSLASLLTETCILLRLDSVKGLRSPAPFCHTSFRSLSL